MKSSLSISKLTNRTPNKKIPKKIHRPFLGLVVCFASGIYLSRMFPVSMSINIIVAMILTGLCVVCFSRARLSTWIILMLYVCMGTIYTNGYQQLAKEDISKVAKYYYGEQVQLEGVVGHDLKVVNFFNGQKTSFTLNVKKMQTQWGWKKKKGKVLVNVFQKLQANYGDTIVIEGKLHRPFEFSKDKSFSYLDYLKRRGIRWVLTAKKNALIEVKSQESHFNVLTTLLNFRGSLEQRFDHALTKNESAIMQALLLGKRSDIPRHIKELFEKTGTIHILAISGLHVGFVAAFFIMLLKPFPVSRKIQLCLGAILLIAYCLMTGARPSVVRATVMTVIVLISLLMERHTNLLNTLSCAAFCLLLINPFYLFDVGYQLSFCCVLSIVCINPLVMKVLVFLCKGNVSKKGQWILQSFSVSLSVWIGIIALIGYYFQIITPITVFINIIIIPFIPVLLALGFGLLLTSFFLPICTVFFAMCLKITLNLMVAIIFLAAKVPGAFFNVYFVSYWGVIAYYSVLIVILFLIYQRCHIYDDTRNYEKFS